jgi:hypothetical protein
MNRFDVQCGLQQRDGAPSHRHRGQIAAPDPSDVAAATTSFQLHLQVPSNRRAATITPRFIVAPLLAAAVNSPLLFGQRLWQETRAAVRAVGGVGK